ncbi:MAG: hypothetical protein HY821_04655 [Acidobacteria bacterium]|nr:hypothetical protein [Acidobacteriota bacterium]
MTSRLSSFCTSLAAAMLVAGGLCAQAQDAADPRNSFKVKLPAESPLSLVSADWGQSNATARGGAMQVDLHSTLVLKNGGVRKIRAVSLLVLAQEVTPGGKGSVTVPSIDVEPGESFPVRIDLRLMRPLAAPGGTLVEVGLDGVLYDDLSFYGPNRMNSKRAMLAWEMEARRDRRALLAALESGGENALRDSLLAAVARTESQPRMAMQVMRSLPATNAGSEKQVEFAFLRIPESPLELMSGEATMAATEARAPRVELRNGGRKPIRYVELGWLVRDAEGKEYPAGTMPAEVSLAPGQQSTVRKDSTLRFAKPVTGLTAYPAVIEFTDGELWVPPSGAWKDPKLAAALPVSGELSRLGNVYRRKGLSAVVQQLRAMR